MNDSKIPKIVIGIGLAALYATGLAFVTLRGAHDDVVAQNAPIAAEPVLPPAILPTSDALASMAEQPAAAAEAAAPVASVAVAKTPGASSTRGAPEATMRGSVPMIAGVATVSRTEEVDFEESNPASGGANARSEPARSTGDTQSVQAESESPTGQNTDVQPQVAPAGSSEVPE